MRAWSVQLSSDGDENGFNSVVISATVNCDVAVADAYLPPLAAITSVYEPRFSKSEVLKLML